MLVLSRQYRSQERSPRPFSRIRISVPYIISSADHTKRLGLSYLPSMAYFFSWALPDLSEKK